MSRPYRATRITPDDQSSSRFGAFKGLINTQSRKDIGLDGLYVADNVLLSDANKIVRRPGYTAKNSSGDIRGGFTVLNNVYLDIAGVMYRRINDNTLRQVTTGLTGRNYDSVEVNGVGYFTNGRESGMVRDDSYTPYRIDAPELTGTSVLSAPVAVSNTLADKYKTRFCATYETADGREGPASNVVEVVSAGKANVFTVTCAPMYAKTHIYATTPNGVQFRRVATTVASVTTVTSSLAGAVLDTAGTYPVPYEFDTVAFYAGRMYLSQYISSIDQSVIWYSTPAGFHLFRYAKNYYMAPGRVVWMAEIRTGLAVGTTRNVLEIVNDELRTHASYGMLPGSSGDVDAEGNAYLWTERGLCSLPDFKNLTETTLSMPAGNSVACKCIHFNGMKQFITVTQGESTPFNRREERT